MKHVKSMMIVFLALAFVSSLMMGCESSYKSKKADVVAKKEKAIEETKAKAKKSKVEAEKKADVRKAAGDVECWGKVDTKAKPKTIDVNGTKYTITQNYMLKAENADAKKPLVFGVLTDIKNNIPQNLENLKKFFAEFKKAGANVILITGDTSENYNMMKPLFDLIAKEGLLTLAIMGNREKKGDYVKAINDSMKANANLVNMNRVRVADLGAVVVLSVAGYYDPNYIHNPPGCPYNENHIAVVKKLATSVGKQVVLFTHGPPKGVGKDAIDVAVEAGNVGDAKLTKLISDASIAFGVFGNIHEAGGKAVTSDMKTVVKEGKFSPSLFLNPGPADSDPWKMNDGSLSRGMAGILTIKGGKASYKIIKAK